MSKSVLISIRPEWCKKIASGQKTIEVRKTRPKIETPFKCYIYCTKSGKILSRGVEILNGCVIGEFVCDIIVEPDHVQNWVYITEHSSIPGPDLYKYCGENENGDTKYCFGWHISDLVIYDKPKELSDFCTGSSVFTFDDEGNQVYTGMKRPPQSWCYVTYI